jgi:hypothetical protein
MAVDDGFGIKNTFECISDLELFQYGAEPVLVSLAQVRREWKSYP